MTRAQKVQVCSTCNGSGICPECNSSGKCEDCEGSGQCSECDGDGECPECSYWSECSVCGGDEICPECQGSGKCIECEGSGDCPECDGDGKCPDCEGTGQLITDLISFLDVLISTAPLQPDGLTDKFDLHHSLGYFESYLVTLENFFKKEAVSIKEYLEDNEFRNDTDSAAFKLHLQNLDSYFPNLFRQSFFVAIFSLMETGLEDVCEQVRKRDKLESLDEFSSKQNLNGNILNKVKEYLVKEANVKFPDSQEWPELQDYVKLRNCVAHRQGRLNSDKRSQYLRNQYIPRQPHLSIQSDSVVFHQAFCSDVIKTVRSFFDQLNKAV